MKILIINPTIGDAYGQEKVILNSTALLREAGHKVYFLMEKSNGNIPPNDGFKMEPKLTKGHPLLSPLSLRRTTQNLLKHIEMVMPDIVHLTDLFPGHLMREIARHFPTLHTSHLNSTTCPASVRIANHNSCCDRKSGWQCLVYDQFQDCMHAYRRGVTKIDVVYNHRDRSQALHGFKKIIGVSKYICKTLNREGWPEDKVELVYNPVLPATSERKERREKSIIIASRLEKHKGVDLALKALKFVPGKWALNICGDGPEKKNLLELTKQLGLEEKVTFLGRTSFDRTKDLLSSSYIFLQVNRGPEPFGLSLAEASSLGTPAVITDIPALNEIIEDGVNGMIAAPNSEIEISEAISLLLNDNKLWEKLSIAGPEVIQKNFSPERHLNETLRIYRKMAGEGLEPPTKGL